MVTLNLLGTFQNPWGSNTSKEIADINRSINNKDKKEFWAPATDTFDAVCGDKAAQKVDSFSSFLGAIQKTKDRTIERANLFSHSDKDLISFSGDIKAPVGNDPVQVMLNSYSAITLNINDPKWLYRGKDASPDLALLAHQLSKKFAANAKLFLFMCKSAADPELIQSIATAFQVNVHGFAAKIYYCPHCENNRIDRSFTSLDACQSSNKGFNHLEARAIEKFPRPWSKYISELVRGPG